MIISFNAMFKFFGFLILCIVIFCALIIYYHEKRVDNMIKEDNHMFNMFELKIDLENEKRLVDLLKTEIVEMSLHESRVQKVKITFYSPELGGINSDSNPKKTAIMEDTIIGWTCAISRDLIELGWLGKKIYIKGIGIRMASDIMGKGITKQIDILVGKNDIKKEAKKLGKNTNILATIL